MIKPEPVPVPQHHQLSLFKTIATIEPFKPYGNVAKDNRTRY